MNKISHEYIVLVRNTLFYYFKMVFIDTRRWFYTFYTFYILLILKHYSYEKNNKHTNKTYQHRPNEDFSMTEIFKLFISIIKEVLCHSYNFTVIYYLWGQYINLLI